MVRYAAFFAFFAVAAIFRFCGSTRRTISLYLDESRRPRFEKCTSNDDSYISRAG